MLLTCTSEEGLPLFKEDVVDYLTLLVFVGGHRLQERKAFCLRIFSVLYVNPVSVTQTET